MNSVDDLLENPFNNRTFQEKLRIKRMGPYQPENFALVEGEESVSKELFRKTPWLTVSQKKNSLFCYYCLLFGGDNLWTRSGVKDTEHLQDKIAQHGSNPTHIKNAVNYKTFGNLEIFRQMSEDRQCSSENQFDVVSRNRQILSDMLDIIKFSGHLDSPARKHDGSHTSPKCDIFLDILSEFSKSDTILEEYLNSGDITPLRTIQNELLECVYEVYAQTIEEEMKNVNYVALQADDVSDVSSNSLFSITLRYCLMNGTLVERFLCFVNASDAEKLASILVQTLNNLNLKDKLIAQAYDGALSMEMPLRDPQVLMANTFPHALCVHSYAHRMYCVVKKACSRIKTARLFFENVDAFSSFFSTPHKLDKILGDHLYEEASVFLGDSTDVELEMINFIVDHKMELITRFKEIQGESFWDDKTLNHSLHLQTLLQDDEFISLLKIFQILLGFVDALYGTLQSEEPSATVVQQALQSFTDSIEELKEHYNSQTRSCSSKAQDLPEERNHDSLQMVIDEVCNIMISEMTNRFKNYHLYYSFSILNPREFDYYAHHFPNEHFETISNSYKMIDKEKLRNELEAMYGSQSFRHTTTSNLPLLLKIYDLQEDFNAVSELLEIILVTPVPTMESGRCFSTLQHVRAFLQNSAPQDNLNALAALAVHREYISSIKGFNEKVIEKFSLQEHRREMYHY